MDIEIDSKHEAQLLRLAKDAGMSVSEYLRLVIEERAARAASIEPEATARRQRQNLDALLQELDALPQQGSADAFSSGDHDAVLALE
jgi:hypothetical protein